MNKIVAARICAALLVALSSCAKKQDYSFALLPTQQRFEPRQFIQHATTVSPRVRILFVEDNSGSMDKFQTQLSDGFQNFANAYLGKKGLDLGVAILTTDTYLAGSVNDPANYGPFMGKCLSRLLPGVHDGLIPQLADGILNAFNDDCSLTPAAEQQLRAAGKRSLRPILNTLPLDGSDPTAAYFAQLSSDFRINVKKGTAGSGSERGLQSLHQFLLDNESRPECSQIPLKDSSCFFPHYDGKEVLVKPINIVAVLSDEHDQSFSNFGVNGAAAIDHTNTSFSGSTDDELKASSATLAALFKQRLDSFFLSLNTSVSTDPLYSVMSIVNIQCNAQLDTGCGLPKHGSRDPDERWGVEYTSLVDALAGYPGDAMRLAHAADATNSAAQFSKVYDINGSNYSGLFTFIASRISDESKVVEFDEFQLDNRMSTTAEMKVVLTLGSGKEINLPNEWLSTQDGFRLLIASQFLNLIPPGDLRASLTVYYTPRCYGQSC